MMTRTNEGSVLTGHYPTRTIDSEVVLSGEIVLEREGGELIHLKQGEILILRGEMHRNQAIERDATFGDRVADAVTGFGGSWVFIIFFGIALAIYIIVDAMLGNRAWPPPARATSEYRRWPKHLLSDGGIGYCLVFAGGFHCRYEVMFKAGFDDVPANSGLRREVFKGPGIVLGYD